MVLCYLICVTRIHDFKLQNEVAIIATSFTELLPHHIRMPTSATPR